VVATRFAIRAARPDEREALEALQRRASMHSGTWTEQLAAHPDAIELPAAQIAGGLVRVAEAGGAIVGFAVLLAASGGACELDGLFVEPERMGAGVGRALVADAVASAREQGASRIEVVANPDAHAFYGRVGFSAGETFATRFGPGLRMRLDIAR
jgi:predicted N-acetyltransferase YhbS